jgi:hypothetical protein
MEITVAYGPFFSRLTVQNKRGIFRIRRAFRSPRGLIGVVAFEEPSTVPEGVVMASKSKGTAGSHSRESEQPGEGDALVTALDEARRSPGDEAAWDQVEILAATLQRPDEVAELYREVLERDLPPVLAASLGRRGAKFCEEWYGESSPALLGILTRVVALDPGAEWAFQRLTVAHTVAARWDDLLAL